MSKKSPTPWLWSSTFKTKAAYFSWVRGQIRRIWSKYPVKTDFKNSRLRPVTTEERDQKIFHPSTKKVGQCEICNNWFAASKLEVDHKIPTEGCTSIDGMKEFLIRMAAEDPKNFALLCKPCHATKTLADKLGCNLEHARAHKQVVALEKKHGKNLQQWLIREGYTEQETSNKDKRRGCLFKMVKGEK